MLGSPQTAPSTFSIKSSRQAILILSGVAGLSMEKIGGIPASLLADFIASFMAKKAEDPKNKGGSPTA